MRHVIKKDQVRLVESGERATRRGVAAPAAGAIPGTARPAARVVESGPGKRAIEFTCTCGEVVLLEVELAAAQPDRSSP